MTRTTNSGYSAVELFARQGPVGLNEKGIIIATNEDRVAGWLRDSIKPFMRGHHVLRYATTKDILDKLIYMSGMVMAFIEVGFFGDAVIGELDRLRKHQPKLQVVLFTVSDIPLEDLSRHLYWGGGSYIPLRDEPEKIEKILRIIFGGGKWAPEDMLGKMRDYDGLSAVEPHLTHQEIEIVRYVAREKTRKEIAHCMKVSESTVKNHLDNIRRKFGIHNMVGILKLAVSQGILPEGELQSCRFKSGTSTRSSVAE
jgi:DNA-binding NarL/FixJ family response regulator